jgi:hypothetical protein
VVKKGLKLHKQFFGKIIRYTVDTFKSGYGVTYHIYQRNIKSSSGDEVYIAVFHFKEVRVGKHRKQGNNNRFLSLSTVTICGIMDN